MRQIILSFAAFILLISCNNEAEKNDADNDTSTKNASLVSDDEASEIDDPTLLSVRGDSIPFKDAITMIKNFQTNAYRLQLARLDSRKLRQLTRSSDSVRLWMAVRPDNTITMILQQKKKNGSNIKFLYYDLLKTSSIGTATTNPVLCPEPQNCDIFIED